MIVRHVNLESGRRLGPYEIISLLGAGGMGEVYRTRDTRLDRTVAVKVLPSGLTANDDLRARFEREARAALYDVGRDGETEYLVMEYRSGTVPCPRVTFSSSVGRLPRRWLRRIGRGSRIATSNRATS